MTERALLFIGLIFTLIGSYCYNDSAQTSGTVIVAEKKHSVYCLISSQLPEDDGPYKQPYSPYIISPTYNSGTTASGVSTSLSPSGSVSPLPSLEV